MSRQILDIQGVGVELKMTRNQIYKFARRPIDPLPHKKLGKQLRFDIEKVYQWFDRQCGPGGQDLGE
jgi:hypothetical protein